MIQAIFAFSKQRANKEKMYWVVITNALIKYK